MIELHCRTTTYRRRRKQDYEGSLWMCRNGVRKTQAHLALEPARYGMDNKKSFHNHMSKKE